MKILYTYTVNKIEKVEERTQNGEEISIKYVDKEVPIVVNLKSPNRKDKSDWATIYNIEFNKALAMGLQPIEFLEKCMQKNCGEAGKRDVAKITEIFNKLVTLSNEIKLIELESNSDELISKNEEYNKLSSEYIELERPYKELQSKSAEFYAQDKTVAWCVLNLTFKDGGGLFFEGDSFDDKLNKFYEIDEKSYLYQVFNKSYVCFYSFILGNVDTGNEEYIKQYFDEITA